MRWKRKEKRAALENESTHVVRRFLLLPLTINGETRWLEIATFIRKFHWGYATYPDLRAVARPDAKYPEYGEWENIDWIN